MLASLVEGGEERDPEHGWAWPLGVPPGPGGVGGSHPCGLGVKRPLLTAPLSGCSHRAGSVMRDTFGALWVQFGAWWCLLLCFPQVATCLIVFQGARWDSQPTQLSVVLAGEGA